LLCSISVVALAQETVPSLSAQTTTPALASREAVPATMPPPVSLIAPSLKVATGQVSDIVHEIEKRRDLAAKLQADAETAKRLSQLDADQVAAVTQALHGELNKENRSAFWVNIGTNLFFAFLGAAFGEAFRALRTRRAPRIPAV
jgi:hypothetical protein